MLTRKDIIHYLNAETAADIETLRAKAYETMAESVGETVYYRGIIELSNICMRNCLYCGIRAGNTTVNRYMLEHETALQAAIWCAQNGYGSVVIQTGEQHKPATIQAILALIQDIKAQTVSEKLPRGLGITLSLGELPLETYKRLREAGAHRYLLRIETSSKTLFERIHPPAQRFEDRINALKDLRYAGFQVGTGVMIGLPHQSVDMLADDVLFFKNMDVDMIGMGPFIPHNATPMASDEFMRFVLPDEKRFQLALNMIAVTRLVCPDINIASTTALQAMVPNGRELGLTYGANVTMPNLTPTAVRKDYTLYDGKPCLEESKTECRACLLSRIASTGRQVGFDEWGDSPHALRREKK